MKIFTANSGRCGSLFLSNIFGALTNFPSFHEPIPNCTGDVLREINQFQPLSKDARSVLDAKIRQIKNDSRNGNYFESSQMFIKCYVEAVLDAFNDIHCIYLYRNPVEVVLSYRKKLRHGEDEWFLQSDWDVNILKTAERLGYWDRILWNCFEVRERFLLYKHRFVKTFEFDFRKLNDISEWRKLFKHFQIPVYFNEIPSVKRNAITEDSKQTLDKLLKGWYETTA